ncbi:MAG: thermonuclease family protein [Nostoc sp.]|uniref:thermonuclease family protein n=1 Tax=Nostoc sp. TaxID=1180 RepID=UPI002FF5C08E
MRFCGIDAVEKQQKLGLQAKSYLQSLIDKGDGTVTITPIEQDRYGRTVAEVFVQPRPGTPGYQSEEEIFLNGDMVRAGFARHYTRYSGNCPNKVVIEQSEKMAIASKAGVWNDPNAVPPWEFRKQKR